MRELIILRTGWLYRCNYEWTHHYEIAKLLKITEEKIVALRLLQPPANQFNELELNDNKDELILEVIGVATTWKLITQFLRSIDVKLEDHLKDWPPDGRSIYS